MTLADLVHFEEFVEPGSATLEALGPFFHRRNVSLSVFKSENGLCAWCNKKPIKKPHKKYCGDTCVSSAGAFCNSNLNGTKAFILKRQAFACAGCGESYEEKLLEKAKKAFRHLTRCEALKANEKLTMWNLAYSTGDFLHIDHVIPIFKGGDGIGFDNLQVLCVPCHKRKTVQEKFL